MRRRDKAGGKAAKVLRSKTLKRRNAPKTALRSSSFAPEKVTDVARLTRERDEARWSSWQLLHSREGLGEHRLADINAIVEESLNLAHHGARAEKQGFNIILERLLDPAAGEVDVVPQEITRALLNLISNGFYAATKRKVEANGGDCEPTPTATTKNLGDRIEITIRDNGTGIPPEVKEKMFNPSFTTKPAGEGTGLGLSISHDIVVKQHGGSIGVNTQPGKFTEIRIVLPRAAVP